MSLVEDSASLRKILGGKSRRPPVFSRVLMVTPEHFTVEYAINPYMKDDGGNLKVVDRERARSQWEALRAIYRKLGYEVVTLPGEPGLPDMVFAANQSFPYWDLRGDCPAVILSRMRSSYRMAEVPHFRRWYASRDYGVKELTGGTFEGNGDCQIDPVFPLLWGGYGPRTQRSVYPEVSQLTGYPVVPLELVHPHFYHLDTCFSILDADTVAVQPQAFREEGLRLVRERFPHVIEVSYEEAREAFAANCHCPNGRDVILQKGAGIFTARLLERGFRIHPVETSEFLKSGGSVYCLKMMLF